MKSSVFIAIPLACLLFVLSAGNASAAHCSGLLGDELSRCQNTTHSIGSADDLEVPHPGATLEVRDRLLGTTFLIFGALATVFIVIGGLRYVLAAGNPEGLQKAKNTILYAIIGLVVSIFAFTIVNFVVSNV